MPVWRRVWLRDEPSLIKSINNFLRERSLLNICKVGLQLRKAAYTDQNAVAATVANLKSRVVVHPSKGSFNQRQAVLLNNRLNDAEGLEVGILEIAFAVIGSCGGVLSEASFCRDIGSLVLSRKKATS